MSGEGNKSEGGKVIPLRIKVLTGVEASIAEAKTRNEQILIEREIAVDSWFNSLAFKKLWDELDELPWTREELAEKAKKIIVKHSSVSKKELKKWEKYIEESLKDSKIKLQKNKEKLTKLEKLEDALINFMEYMENEFNHWVDNLEIVK